MIEHTSGLLRAYESGARIVELDLARGVAILMMIVHHIVFDLRDAFHVPGLDFERSIWVQSLLRPFFLIVFLGVSGICARFSRDNVKRGLKLAVVALLVTLVTVLADISHVSPYGPILWNVLHTLAVSILVGSWLTKNQGCTMTATVKKRILLIAVAVLVLPTILPRVVHTHGLWAWLGVPFGLIPADLPMMDVLPLVPWLGVYLIGVVNGSSVYVDGRSKLHLSRRTLRVLSPALFAGRYALFVYLLHQPLVYGVLSGLKALGLWT